MNNLFIIIIICLTIIIGIFITIIIVNNNCNKYLPKLTDDEIRYITSNKTVSNSIFLMPNFHTITPNELKSNFNIKSISVNNSLTPIVIIPGLAGSVLTATGTKQSTVAPFCNKKLKEDQLWVSSQILLPNSLSKNCWMDNFTPRYDINTHIYSSAPGLKVDTPSFGSTFAIDSLFHIYGHQISIAGTYFHQFIKAMIKIGYTDNKNIHGAPYDFRLIIDNNYLHNYIYKTKKLIEETYTRNNNLAIMLIGHSLGGCISHQFLISMSKEWKNKYINCFVSVSSVFGGAPKAMKPSLSGDDLGLPGVNPIDLKPAMKLTGGALLLYPDKDLYTSPFISIKTNNYDSKLQNLKKLYINEFKDPIIYDIIENLTLDKRNWYEPPNVTTHIIRVKNTGITECMYYYKDTKSLPSILGEQEYYKILFAANSPSIHNEKLEDMFGDQTVPYISLRLPMKIWPSKQTQKIQEHIVVSDKIDHMTLVQSYQFVDIIQSILIK